MELVWSLSQVRFIVSTPPPFFLFGQHLLSTLQKKPLLNFCHVQAHRIHFFIPHKLSPHPGGGGVGVSKLPDDGKGFVMHLALYTKKKKYYYYHYYWGGFFFGKKDAFLKWRLWGRHDIYNYIYTENPEQNGKKIISLLQPWYCTYKHQRNFKLQDRTTLFPPQLKLIQTRG